MNKTMTSLVKALSVGGIIALSLVVDVGPERISLEPQEAEAVIGRPLTPISYAGVARRTVRRGRYYR